MTSSPTPGHQPWGHESWNESRPSRVPMVQIWMLSDEWLSRYELLKNLHIKLCHSVTGMRTRTRKRTTGATTIPLLVLHSGELKMVLASPRLSLRLTGRARTGRPSVRIMWLGVVSLWYDWKIVESVESKQQTCIRCDSSGHQRCCSPLVLYIDV